MTQPTLRARFVVAFVITVMLAAALGTPAHAVQPLSDLDEIRHEIDRVDREDMRVKRGKVEGDTMTLRVEDQKRSRGRPFVYGKNVEIDVSSLEESAEIAAGDAATLHEANAYTDEAISNIEIEHPDWQPQIDAAEQRSHDHTDVAVAGAKAHAEAGDAATLHEAQGYSDANDRRVLDAANAASAEGDAETLSAARQHAEEADAETLTSAQGYADEGDEATLSEAVSYTNGIAEGLATVDRALGARLDYLRQDAVAMHNKQGGQIEGLSRGLDAVSGLASANAFAIDALDNRVDGVEAQVRDLQFALDEQRRRYREAIAGTTAIGMVQQDPSANGVQLSVGVGHFQGSNAGSVVIGTRIADRVYVNAGASYGAATTYGASATVRLGGDLFVVSRRRR